MLAVTRGQSGDVGVGCVEMWVLAATPGQSGDVGVGCHPWAVWRCGCWLCGDVGVGCHPWAVWRCGNSVGCHPGAALKGTQSEEALHALLIIKKNGVKNIHSTLCVDLWSGLCKS